MNDDSFEKARNSILAAHREYESQKADLLKSARQMNINDQFDVDDLLNSEKEYRQAKDGALFDTAKMLKEINSRMDREHQKLTARMDKERDERLEADRKASSIAASRHKHAMIIGWFTFIASVVFGIIGLFR